MEIQSASPIIRIFYVTSLLAISFSGFSMQECLERCPDGTCSPCDNTTSNGNLTQSDTSNDATTSDTLQTAGAWDTIVGTDAGQTPASDIHTDTGVTTTASLGSSAGDSGLSGTGTFPSGSGGAGPDSVDAGTGQAGWGGFLDISAIDSTNALPGIPSNDTSSVSDSTTPGSLFSIYASDITDGHSPTTLNRQTPVMTSPAQATDDKVDFNLDDLSFDIPGVVGAVDSRSDPVLDSSDTNYIKIGDARDPQTIPSAATEPGLSPDPGLSPSPGFSPGSSPGSAPQPDAGSDLQTPGAVPPDSPWWPDEKEQGDKSSNKDEDVMDVLQIVFFVAPCVGAVLAGIGVFCIIRCATAKRRKRQRLMRKLKKQRKEEEKKMKQKQQQQEQQQQQQQKDASQTKVKEENETNDKQQQRQKKRKKHHRQQEKEDDHYQQHLQHHSYYNNGYTSPPEYKEKRGKSPRK